METQTLGMLTLINDFLKVLKCRASVNKISSHRELTNEKRQNDGSVNAFSEAAAKWNSESYVNTRTAHLLCQGWLVVNSP